MEVQGKARIKKAMLSFVMGSLFLGGVLFCGADWEWPGFPWGILIGALCWAGLFFLTRYFQETIDGNF